MDGFVGREPDQPGVGGNIRVFSPVGKKKGKKKGQASQASTILSHENVGVSSFETSL
jgi:hypothetical protein